MPTIELRAMRPDEWDLVAELICNSTNAWYRAAGKAAIFPAGPSSTRLFCEVYEALDPGCCVVAEDRSTGRLLGSCFYHPRQTHVSLGIMNSHPDAFGQGIAGMLLRFVIDEANLRGLPVRLVASAMNLDSYSLYTRQGFVPRLAFQDMLLPNHTRLPARLDGSERIRDATLDDVAAIAELEFELTGIRRTHDYQFFIENRQRIWHTSVFEINGHIDGFLASVAHPASNMLGPGAMRSATVAAALIHRELQHQAGRTPVFLVPVECTELVQTLYGWGARNCELHFLQVRGDYQPPRGIVMPTFMPETG